MRCSSRASTRTRHRSARRTYSSTQQEACALRRMLAEKGEPAIRQIGELLRTSLAESAFPVPLRLVITQACSTPPSYASIAELSSALEYFERPDRPGLIRAVYERAQGYQPVSAAVTQDTPEPEAEKPARPNKRQPRRIPKTAIAASVAAGTLIVFLLVVSQLPTGQQGNAGADQPKKTRRCADRDRFFSGRAGRSREPIHGELVTRGAESSSRESEDHRRIAAAKLSAGQWQGSHVLHRKPCSPPLTPRRRWPLTFPLATRCRRAMRPTRKPWRRSRPRGPSMRVRKR